MSANVDMNSDFLSRSRYCNYSGDKRVCYVGWDCTPGRVPYNYVIPGGSTQRHGYYHHDGIYRWNGGGYSKAAFRYGLFEGVKCITIQCRKNYGEWWTTHDPNGLTSFGIDYSTSKNGDVFDIRATYEVWTMGSPFRDVPFMWFGSLTGWYNDYNNQFSGSAPANPGRTWSGMCNYTQSGNKGTDQNSSWNITRYSWYQPNSSSNNTNWTYLHANDYYKRGLTSSNGWLSSYACEKWLSGMPYNNTELDGWTGNVTGAKPQKTRKSSWWTFQRTFTDSITVWNINERPDPLANPTIGLSVVDNLKVASPNKGFDGTEGTVRLTYRQANGVAGTYHLYAYQLDENWNFKYIKEVSSGTIYNNETKDIRVDFKTGGFIRSRNVAYRVDVSIWDGEYNTNRYATTPGWDASWNQLISHGTHYFNDEPWYPNWVSLNNENNNITLSWPACGDPDGHSVYYTIYVCRQNASAASIPLRVRRNDGSWYDTKTIYYYHSFSTTGTSYTLPDVYPDGELLTIYVCPSDNYWNDYWYASTGVQTVVGTNPRIYLHVDDNMARKKGDEGILEYTYTHRNGLDANINIYAYVGYAKNGLTTCRGWFAHEVFSKQGVKPNERQTITIDFEKEGFPRGHYIKYFAVATDTNGEHTVIPCEIKSDYMWDKVQGYHHFNDSPTPSTPFITEDKNTAYQDDIIEVAWNKSTDTEGHTVFYKMYIQYSENDPHTEIFYFNNYNDAKTMRYAKVIDLGSTTLPTERNPYLLNGVDFIAKDAKVWIKTYDEFNSKKYLSGNILNIHSPGINANEPQVRLSYAYGRNIMDEEKVDGENGYVSVSYSHPGGRNGTVTLHAMCKKLDGSNQMKIFNNIHEWNLSSGSWSPDTKINFPTEFGEEWRSSEVRYYATAKTYLGESSVPKDWTPTTDMWNSWRASHKFNDVPGDITIREVLEETDHHNKVTIAWDPAIDIDDDAPPMYAVFIAAQDHLTTTMAFHYGADKSKDMLKTFSDVYSTPNNKIQIDLSAYDEGEKIIVWVVPYDDYANSYLYTSNEISFNKIRFGNPKVSASLDQDSSEYGNLTIKYEHTALELINGQYVKRDNLDLRSMDDLAGKVDIYCYIDNDYTINFSIRDEEFAVGEEKTFEIDFSRICPYSRSHEIRYFILAHDNYAGVYNIENKWPEDAEPMDLTDYYHYYNDEPYDPIVEVGPLLNEEDKKIYGFDYINIAWEPPFEPDGDARIYYLYLNSHAATGKSEDIKTATLYGREWTSVIEYTRKYKIIEKYNSSTGETGCTVEYCTGTDEYDNEEYELLQENPFIGIQINYKGDHLGKVWLEKIDYIIYVEAKDSRPWSNSYYGISEEYVNKRNRHEPPYEVQLNVIYNLTDTGANGEEGRVTITYTHPEELDAIVDLYAYQDGKLIGKVYSGEFSSGVSQDITVDFTKDIENNKLIRSKDITYYAVATDTLVGYKSLDRFKHDKEDAEGLPIEFIPLLEADNEGKYNYHDINVNGIVYSFNSGGKYIGPVQKGRHYYNEEPPGTSPEIYDKEKISFKSAEITWPHVVDPDGHDVSYEIYIAGTDGDERMNDSIAYFFNDNIPEENPTILAEENDGNPNVKTTVENTIVAASGDIRYHKMVKIPASLAQSAANHFTVSTEEYSADATINIWIVSKDQYLNSYYRAGNILSLFKGHEAREPLGCYPRNGSTVYATQPRILIKLAPDNQKQTVYVGWKATEYNSKDHPEMFSSEPCTKDTIIFKPPVAYTDLSGTKVTYYVYVHNQCTYSSKIYATYTYKDFFDNLTDDRLIALKSDHINLFRKAVTVTRDAYGLLAPKYTRDIKKGMILENYDFNDTKNAICEVNDLLNNADDSEDLDYINPLIVNLNDLDVSEYEGTIGALDYRDFIEWARLLYILQNL